MNKFIVTQIAKEYLSSDAGRIQSPLGLGPIWPVCETCKNGFILLGSSTNSYIVYMIERMYEGYPETYSRDYFVCSTGCADMYILANI